MYSDKVCDPNVIRINYKKLFNIDSNNMDNSFTLFWIIERRFDQCRNRCNSWTHVSQTIQSFYQLRNAKFHDTLI